MMVLYARIAAVRWHVLVVFVSIATLVHRSPALAFGCPGDCNDDGEVTVDELVRGVNIALGSAPVNVCPRSDPSGDGEVTIDELITAVGNALDGCAPAPTAAPTATATPTPGEGDMIPPSDPAALTEWLQAGRYRGWRAESIPHVSGGPHGRIVRTYLNDIVYESLVAGNATHPKGAALVKELYYGGTTVQEWAVEIKIQDDSAGGSGWYWYEGEGLAGRGLGICTGCHGAGFSTYVSKDFVLTPFPLQ